MAVKAKMPRTKKTQIEVRHAVYGPGKVVERRATENGSDALLIRFPDGEIRTLLAAERYWVDLNLAAIPVCEPRKTKDVAQKKQEVAGEAIEEPELELEIA